MPDKTANWGVPGSGARYRTQDSDPSGGGNFVVAQRLDSNGDPVDVLLEWDETAGEWRYGGPVNLDGEDVTNVGAFDADSVNTDETYYGSHPGVDIIAGSDQYPTITDALSGVNTQATILCKNIAGTNPEFDETVVFTGAHRSIEGAGGQGSVQWYGSGEHLVELVDNDQELVGFWLEQTDASGDYDAVHASGKEARLRDIGVDAAPRYGVYFNGSNESMLLQSEITNDGVSGVRLSGSSHCIISDTQIKNSTFTDSAIRVESDCDNNHISAVIRAIDGDGLDDTVGPLSAGGNHYDLAIHNTTGFGAKLGRFANLDATISDTGGDALIIGGRENTATVNIQNPGGNALTLDGNNNTVMITSDGGDVVINGDNNTVIGSADDASLTDNGSGNNTSALVVTA